MGQSQNIRYYAAWQPAQACMLQHSCMNVGLPTFHSNATYSKQLSLSIVPCIRDSGIFGESLRNKKRCISDQEKTWNARPWGSFWPLNCNETVLHGTKIINLSGTTYKPICACACSCASVHVLVPEYFFTIYWMIVALSSTTTFVVKACLQWQSQDCMQETPRK